MTTNPLRKANASSSSMTNRLLKVDDEFTLFEAVRLKPGAAMIFYANAPTGTSLSLALERVPNSGGHHHGGATREPLAVGAINPSSIVLNGPYPQNVPVTYTAPEVSGSVRLLFSFSNGVSGENLAEIMYDSFLPIPQSTGITLKAPETMHPSPYWGEPAFITKLRSLGEKYFAATNKDIIITDGSCLWGGRFDLNGDWRPPHAEHRNGRQADVRLRDMTNSDRDAFRRACTEVGITAEIHSGNHWHIRG